MLNLIILWSSHSLISPWLAYNTFTVETRDYTVEFLQNVKRNMEYEEQIDVSRLQDNIQIDSLTDYLVQYLVVTGYLSTMSEILINFCAWSDFIVSMLKTKKRQQWDLLGPICFIFIFISQYTNKSFEDGYRKIKTISFILKYLNGNHKNLFIKAAYYQCQRIWNGRVNIFSNDYLYFGELIVERTTIEARTSWFIQSN